MLDWALDMRQTKIFRNLAIAGYAVTTLWQLSYLVLPEVSSLYGPVFYALLVLSSGLLFIDTYLNTKKIFVSLVIAIGFGALVFAVLYVLLLISAFLQI